METVATNEPPAEYRFPEGVKTTIEPRRVRWIMDWSGKTPDGQRRYPDKPEKEPQFEQEPALALLLLNEVIFLNSNWWEHCWPEGAKKTTALCVDCSDVFMWGCADAETITLDELEELFGWWEKDEQWGAAVWCMIKRREMPQRPVEDRIRQRGMIDLDAVQAEHNLRKNHANGISGVLARHQYDAYCAWERSEGRDARPFDAKWWDGWKQFTTANPGWNTDEWKAEETRLRSEWRAANGYEPHQEHDTKEAV